LSSKIFKAILFDLDGVILDSMDQHAAAWLEVMSGEGLQVSREFILAHEGCLAQEVLANLLQEQGRAPAPSEDLPGYMESLLERQARLFQSLHAGQVRPYASAEALVRGLSQKGLSQALVTSSRRAQVEQCLSPALRAHFQVIVTREDVAQHKPHPEPYLAAMAALGVEAGRCLVVENAPAGIAAGLAAGATCFAVCSTLGPEHLSQAHAVFPDLAALAQHLGLNGQG
jgi:beta-phosphoglucomutase